MEILFEWDEHKRRTNRRKHGIDLADAIEVFYDDLACAMVDPDHHAEQRFVLTGTDAFGASWSSFIPNPTNKPSASFRCDRPRLPSVDTTNKAELCVANTTFLIANAARSSRRQKSASPSAWIRTSSRV